MSRQTSRLDRVDLAPLAEQWRLRRDEEGLQVIPGRRGHVAAHDLAALCVYFRGARLVRKALRQLTPGWRRHQTGDTEANVLALVADLDLACRLIGAYRRRRLSEEQKARLAAVGAGGRFSRPEHGAGEPFARRISTIEPVPFSPATPLPGDAPWTN
jgi:hypothetical protein